MQLISIGKSSSNKIAINNPHISNYHAEILLGDDGSVFITDKGSTNGTTVRGQKIQPETEVSVNRGDKVTFAGVVDMDWSKIPVIMPPPPGWKLFSIGNGLKNRIHVNDPTGRVSRYHATLKVDPKGKIFLTDHSSNGTFVNDMRLTSGQEMRIKRKDRISFANAASLNWGLIKLPSPIPWKYIAAAAAAIIICMGIYGYFTADDSDSWLGRMYVRITGTGVDTGGGDTIEKLYKTYNKSIVFVFHSYQIVGYYPANTKQNPERLYVSSGTSTAFFVDREGTMVTNRHVTIPWESTVEYLKQQQEYKKYDKIVGETIFVGVAINGTYISKDPNILDFQACTILKRTTDSNEKDIGLMKVNSPSQLPQQFTPVNLNKAFIDSKKITVGEPVYLIGYPLGKDMLDNISTGTANTVEVKLTSHAGTVTQAPDAYKFGHSAIAAGGSSGSPMFNKKGQLIGVLNAGMEKTQGYAWAILAKHAKDLYDKE